MLQLTKTTPFAAAKAICFAAETLDILVKGPAGII
jgi:hypothetical protein